MPLDTERIGQYRRDGVARLEQVIAPEWIERLRAGVEENMARPGPFAKLYFLRPGDVDARAAVDAQSSFCTVTLVSGPNGLTYAIVHTGATSAPFIVPAAPPGA